MKAEQIAQRLFNTVTNGVSRLDTNTRLEVYQILLDDIEREMGTLEDEGVSDDERFSHNTDDDEDEDD